MPQPASELNSLNSVLLISQMVTAVVFASIMSFRNQVESRKIFYSDQLSKIEKLRAEGIAESARMIAHDLRKGLLSLKKTADPELQNLTKIMEPILFDMLTLGKQNHKSNESCSLNIILQEILDQLNSQYNTIDVSNISVAHPEQIEVAVSSNILRRILWNLLDNAYQALDNLPKGDRKIWIATKFTHENAVRLVVGNSCAKDDIPDVDRIFEPHYSKGKIKGTGLGLAIVQKMIIESGGWIAASLQTSPDAIEFHLSISKVKESVGTVLTTDKHIVYLIEDNIFVLSDWQRALHKDTLVSFESASRFV